MADRSAFISYRRGDGYPWARLIWDELRTRDVNAFLDLESMRQAGRFDVRLLNQIAARPYFLMVLTEDSLERCVSERDWVRREIEHAIETERIIVPLFIAPFEVAMFPPDLPPRISETLANSNGVTFYTQFLAAALDQLAEFLEPVALPGGDLDDDDDEFEQQAIEQVRSVPPATLPPPTVDPPPPPTEVERGVAESGSIASEFSVTEEPDHREGHDDDAPGDQGDGEGTAAGAAGAAVAAEGSAAAATDEAALEPDVDQRGSDGGVGHVVDGDAAAASIEPGHVIDGEAAGSEGAAAGGVLEPGGDEAASVESEGAAGAGSADETAASVGPGAESDVEVAGSDGVVAGEAGAASVESERGAGAGGADEVGPGAESDVEVAGSDGVVAGEAGAASVESGVVVDAGGDGLEGAAGAAVVEDVSHEAPSVERGGVAGSGSGGSGDGVPQGVADADGTALSVEPGDNASVGAGGTDGPADGVAAGLTRSAVASDVSSRVEPATGASDDVGGAGAAWADERDGVADGGAARSGANAATSSSDAVIDDDLADALDGSTWQDPFADDDDGGRRPNRTLVVAGVVALALILLGVVYVASRDTSETATTNPTTTQVTQNTPPPEIEPSSLAADEWLEANDSIVDGAAALTMFADGRLALTYRGEVLDWAWEIPPRPGAAAVFQGDGNFVVYPFKSPHEGFVRDDAIWASFTENQGGTELRITDTGSTALLKITRDDGSTVFEIAGQ